MRFVTYERDGEATVGVLTEAGVFALPGYTDMLTVLAFPDKAVVAAKNALSGAPTTLLSQVKMLAPLRPPRIFCIGLNYASHAAESQMKVQAAPTVFMKLSSSVVGPGAEVVLPYNSTQPDYEAELAVVTGEGGYRIPDVAWEEHVF